MIFVIGICDDCPEQVALQKKYLQYCRGNDEFIIVESSQPEDFFGKIEVSRPQIVLLDIDMGPVNGIQLGEKIKALLGNVVIIYITAYEQYALEAFRIRAFHYLLKPLSKEKFMETLDEAVGFVRKSLGKKPEKTFMVQVKGETLCLNYSSIYYFEKIGHRIKIHTENREIYYYGNICSLLEKIGGEAFLQCHQGYIVNVDKIRAFREKTLFLDEGLQLPVSRSFVENIKEMLAKRLFAGKEQQ